MHACTVSLILAISVGDNNQGINWLHNAHVKDADALLDPEIQKLKNCSFTKIDKNFANYLLKTKDKKMLCSSKI